MGEKQHPWKKGLYNQKKKAEVWGVARLAGTLQCCQGGKEGNATLVGA